jgi:hypothetical protein
MVPMPLAPLAAAEARVDEMHVDAVAEGREDLAAVDEVVVAVAHGSRGRDRGGVGARLRFGPGDASIRARHLTKARDQAAA